MRQSVTPQVTLDQLHVLDTLERCGSVAKASQSLRKAHSAVLRSLANLETTLGVELVNRQGYRLQLSDVGQQILQRGRQLLQAEEELRGLASSFQLGWESELRIVYDGFLDSEPLLRAAQAVRTAHRDTHVCLINEFLSGVPAAFAAKDASAMITVVGDLDNQKSARKLPVVRSHLVAKRGHELARKKSSALDLERHSFLVVRGRDEHLHLPTSSLNSLSVIQVGDFHAKRQAVLRGYGFGWLPEYLIASDLKRGTLAPVKWEGESVHFLQPLLVVRSTRTHGLGLQLFIRSLLEECKISDKP